MCRFFIVSASSVRKPQNILAGEQVLTLSSLAASNQMVKKNGYVIYVRDTVSFIVPSFCNLLVKSRVSCGSGYKYSGASLYVSFQSESFYDE